MFEYSDSFSGNKLIFYTKFLEKYYLFPKFESYATYIYSSLLDTSLIPSF